MATKTATMTRWGNWVKWTWAAITENDVAQSVPIPQNVSDIHIRQVGTVGGSTLAMWGGFVETTATALEKSGLVDSAGTTIAITATTAGVAAASIKDRFPYMAPAMTGGSSQSVTPELWYCIVDRPSKVGLQEGT